MSKATGARGGSCPRTPWFPFAGALSIGVSTLEMDVGVTRDGVVVVTHNLRLQPETTRDADGNWLQTTGPAVRSLTLEEIKAFDVGRIKPGTPYALRFPDQAPADGTRMPTLEEVIGLVRRSGNDSVRFNIETKLKPAEADLSPNPEDFVEAVLSVVRVQGVADRVTIQSFDWRTLQETHRQAPDVPTSYLTVRQEWLDNLRVGESGPSPVDGGIRYR